jgi:hypothetical protein
MKKNEGSIAQGILLGFRTDIHPLKRCLSSDEVSRLTKELSGFDIIPGKLRIRLADEIGRSRFFPYIPGSPMKPPYLGQYVVEWEHDDISEFDKEYNLILKTLLALRLLKQGPVFLASMYSFRRGARSWGLVKVITSPPQNFYGSYTLYLHEKSRLIEIFERILPIDFQRNISLRIACDRFLRYYHEHHLEDRIIDLFIGFEALFRIGPETKSKSTAIAPKCSKLVGKDDPEIAEINTKIREAYKLRNAIVHGDKPEGSEIEDLTILLEDYLRRSILQSF